MKNKTGIFLMITGTVLICSALFLLVFNNVEDQQAGKASKAILEQMQPLIQENITQEETIEMPSVEIDGYSYIGYITIPSLNLELPIHSEWNYNRLSISPCLQKGSIVNHDMVIAGHAMMHHFGKLIQLSNGDEIIFTNMLGQSYSYIVVLKEELTKYQVNEMLYSDYDLTLYTCDYSGQDRITIRANRY